jgi:hypothetical protein
MPRHVTHFRPSRLGRGGHFFSCWHAQVLAGQRCEGAGSTILGKTLVARPFWSVLPAGITLIESTLANDAGAKQPAGTSNSSVSAFQETAVTPPNDSSGLCRPSVRRYSCTPASKLPEWRQLPSAAQPRETSPDLPVSNVTGADLGSGDAFASSQGHN